MEVRCTALSPDAQTPSVYQSLVSPATVVTCACTVSWPAAGVSAFQDATSRVNAAADTFAEVHVPLTAPGFRTTWFPSRVVDSKVPSLRTERVYWIGAGAAAAGAESARSRTRARTAKRIVARVYER